MRRLTRRLYTSRSKWTCSKCAQNHFMPWITSSPWCSTRCPSPSVKLNNCLESELMLPYMLEISSRCLYIYPLHPVCAVPLPPELFIQRDSRSALVNPFHSSPHPTLQLSGTFSSRAYCYSPPWCSGAGGSNVDILINTSNTDTQQPPSVVEKRRKASSSECFRKPRGIIIDI